MPGTRGEGGDRWTLGARGAVGGRRYVARPQGRLLSRRQAGRPGTRRVDPRALRVYPPAPIESQPGGYGSRPESAASADWLSQSSSDLSDQSFPIRRASEHASEGDQIRGKLHAGLWPHRSHPGRSAPHSCALRAGGCSRDTERKRTTEHRPSRRFVHRSPALSFLPRLTLYLALTLWDFAHRPRLRQGLTPWRQGRDR
eukprot:COSAG01_NODE_9766_length_2347_cov_31.477333_2_plen_199_part_00